MRRDTDRERGFTTAETAVAFPVLVFVLAAVMVLLGVMVDQIRCVDAARVGARSVARGDSISKAKNLATQVAPKDSDIRVAGSSVVTVTVTAPERPFGGQALRARASATAPDESVGVSGRRLGALPLEPAGVPAEVW